MSNLYESLQVANRSERQEVASRLIYAMHDGNPDAHEEFYTLACDVITRQDLPPDDPNRPRGVVFPASDSVEMVRIVPRVGGYLRAIRRVSDVYTAIDAGTGPTAILALGVAAQHEHAEVLGIEINEGAALCADALVKVLGMDDRITIRRADVLEESLPQADLGLTETFTMGLLFEPGHKITSALARSCRQVLPAKAELWAIDDDRTMSLTEQHLTKGDLLTDFYQFVGEVDFTEENEEFSGRLISTGSGERFPYVAVGYYDARGKAIIPPGGGSIIALPVPLDRVWVEEPGSIINFRYTLGSDLITPPPTIWIEPPEHSC